ncbi:polymorphic toxin type 44 domain-containing protein [Magnetofaba australis]
METTRQGSDLSWINNVRDNGEWDFKNSDPKNHSWAQRERAGNINYGATCVAAGYAPATCLRAGGVFQGAMDLVRGKGWYPNSSGRPWDQNPESCYGEPDDDCKQVIEGIRYGQEVARRRRLGQ